MPLVRALPINPRAEPEPRAQPVIKSDANGGAEPRLTSGGKAAAEDEKDFSGKSLTSGGKAAAEDEKDFSGTAGQSPASHQAAKPQRWFAKSFFVQSWF